MKKKLMIIFKCLKKDAVPLEKRTPFDKINKIIFKDCKFRNHLIHNLKGFFIKLFFYPNITKLAIYQNETKLEFTGWEY